MWSSGLRIVLSIIYLIFIHILIFLVVYCYLYTMFANPGEPPQYWGFYYDKPEVRKQRYFRRVTSEFRGFIDIFD